MSHSHSPKYSGYLKGVMHPMRYLHFTVDSPAKRYYELCAQGVTNTSREINIKREARIYDKLVTKFEDAGTKDANGLYELTTDMFVSLEDSEYELLIDCLEQVKWSAQGVREAYKLLDWIKESPTKPTFTSE